MVPNIMNTELNEARFIFIKTVKATSGGDDQCARDEDSRTIQRVVCDQHVEGYLVKFHLMPCYVKFRIHKTDGAVNLSGNIGWDEVAVRRGDGY